MVESKRKVRVGVLFGGRSGEHEVSLLSAASVMQALDRKKFEIVPIGITKEGRWVAAQDAERLLAGSYANDSELRAGDPAATSTAAVLSKGDAVIMPPVPDSSSMVPFETPQKKSGAIDVDVIFPVLHGTFGEDGTIQGLLELADIAYVGAGVLGSAAGMDKVIMKRLFKAARLPIVKDVTVLRSEWEDTPKKVLASVEGELRYPMFVKPANLGSSVGISKAHDRSELKTALDEAAQYDRKLVVEQGVGGKKQKAREIEVSVLGNDHVEASVPGEIVPAKEFYDYEAKYISAGSELMIPAKLSRKLQKDVQALAIEAFRAVDCTGLARVDFLMEPKTEKLFVNEINTMPGFTAISMYQKLWAASGLGYSDLLTRLGELAQQRHADKKRNRYAR